MNSREAFRQYYRAARIVRKSRRLETAYLVADYALDHLVCEENLDYKLFIDYFDAILWAIHWKFFKPVNTPPIGMSERHFGFHADENGTEVFWSRRPLP